MLFKFVHRSSFTCLLMSGLCLAFLFVGCSEDTTTPDDNTGGVDVIQAAGLSGDTYRSIEYLFKMSKLPTEGWIIKEPSNLASYDLLKTWRAAFDLGTKFNKNEDLLLLEPTDEASFQDTLATAYETGTPYIFLQIIEQTATGYTTPKQYMDGYLADIPTVYGPETEAFELGEKAELLSRDRMPGYSQEIRWIEYENPDTGAAVLSVGRMKDVVFMRGESTQFVYHLSYWAPEDQYDQYLPIFDQIVEYLEFNAA